MRMTCRVAILVALAAVGLAAQNPVAADGRPGDAVRRTSHGSALHARGLWPGGPDPFAYSYARTSYYPYYNSDYWVPRAEMRYRTRYPFQLPGYASTWGYPLSCKIQRRGNCGVPYR